MQNDWVLWNARSTSLLPRVNSKLCQQWPSAFCFYLYQSSVKFAGIVPLNTFRNSPFPFHGQWSIWQSFIFPLVPVFVLPGSVSDGVPPSDWCAKQWRSALALQTTPGALTSPVRPPPLPAAVRNNMVSHRLHTAGFSCCWCRTLTSNSHAPIALHKTHGLSVWARKIYWHIVIQATFFFFFFFINYWNLFSLFGVMRFSRDRSLISMWQAFLLRHVVSSAHKISLVIRQSLRAVCWLCSFYTSHKERCVCVGNINVVFDAQLSRLERMWPAWGTEQEYWRTKRRVFVRGLK